MSDAPEPTLDDTELDWLIAGIVQPGTPVIGYSKAHEERVEKLCPQKDKRRPGVRRPRCTVSHEPIPPETVHFDLQITPPADVRSR